MASEKAQVIDVPLDKDPKKKAKKGLEKRLSVEKKTATAEQIKEKQDKADLRKANSDKEIAFKAKTMGTAAVDYAKENLKEDKLTKEQIKEQQAAAERRNQNLLKEKAFKAKTMGTLPVEYAKENLQGKKLTKEQIEEKQAAAELRKSKSDKEKAFLANTMGTSAVDYAKSKSGEAAVQNDKNKASKESLPASNSFAGGDYSIPTPDGVIDVDVGKKGKTKGKKGLIKRLSKTKKTGSQENVDKKAEEAASRKKKLDSEKVMPTDLEAAKARAAGPEGQAAKARAEIFAKKL